MAKSKKTPSTKLIGPTASAPEVISHPEGVYFNETGVRDFCSKFSKDISKVFMTVASFDEATKVLRVTHKGARGIFQVPEKYVTPA